MRISDWSSDVCSSDLHDVTALERAGAGRVRIAGVAEAFDAVLFATGRQPNTGDLGLDAAGVDTDAAGHVCVDARQDTSADGVHAVGDVTDRVALTPVRSEEHTSELQSLMRISYAVFCLNKKNKDRRYSHKLTETNENYRQKT